MMISLLFPLSSLQKALKDQNILGFTLFVLEADHSIICNLIQGLTMFSCVCVCVCVRACVRACVWALSSFINQ